MKTSELLSKRLESEFSYIEQLEKMRISDPGLQKILMKIEKPEGRAIIFSHDDPDGITSGLILKRTLQKKGWEVDLLLPEGFVLQKEIFEKVINSHKDLSCVFILDKGTLDEYSEFGARIPFYIIDHHPTSKLPLNCVIYNPSVPKYTWCSTSILVHGIATLLNTRDDYDDFLCLVGLKGDWAIEPITGTISDFVIPFYNEYGKKYENLLKAVSERPTQFDSTQRVVTCLLSRIAEFVHATGGGGFSYFYHDRDEELRNLDHPKCIAEALYNLASKVESIKKIEKFDDFVELIDEPHKHLLVKIFNFFLEDWQKAERILDTTIEFTRINKCTIYMFVGNKVPLLPMIGSIKLFELSLKNKNEAAQIIMISKVAENYIHISVRATSDIVHSGKICNNLQNRLQKKFTESKSLISGGGHPKAAECTVRTDVVSCFDVISEIIDIIRQLKEIDTLFVQNLLDDNSKRKAKELGLEYIV